MAYTSTEPTGPVLVLNAGSSSIKAQLRDQDGAVLWRDQTGWSTEGEAAKVLDHWLAPAIEPWRERIALVGHRVVHGGELFSAPTKLTDEVLDAIEALLPLAPLHNRPALQLMRGLQCWRPDLAQWACFDTAFHSTLPPEACTYALPGAWRRHGLRRFGFHGLNHQHVSETVLRQFGDCSRLISCHLGAGCSLCAIKSGRSIATTMGFTPMEGLVMATRCGSVDPGLLLHQLRHGITPSELDHALNSGSGLLGLSELSGDMRELREAKAAGHDGARLAIQVFQHQLLQAIGAMAASLEGVEVIALSGGIGEHDEALREELRQALIWLMPFELVVIPADEEGLIARSCRAAARDKR